MSGPIYSGGVEDEVQHAANDAIDAAEVRPDVGIGHVVARAVCQAEGDVVHRDVAVVARDGGEGVAGRVEGRRLEAEVAREELHAVAERGTDDVYGREPLVEVENAEPLPVPIAVEDVGYLRGDGDRDERPPQLLLSRLRPAVVDAAVAIRLAGVDVHDVHPGKSEREEEHVAGKEARGRAPAARLVGGDPADDVGGDGLLLVGYMQVGDEVAERVVGDDDVARVVVVVLAQHFIIYPLKDREISLDGRVAKRAGVLEAAVIALEPGFEVAEEGRVEPSNRQRFGADEADEVGEEGAVEISCALFRQALDSRPEEGKVVQRLLLVHLPVKEGDDRAGILALLDDVPGVINDTPQGADAAVERIFDVSVRDGAGAGATLEADEGRKDGRGQIRRRPVVIDSDFGIERPVLFLVVLEDHP